MASLEAQIEDLKARVNALENATGLTRPTTSKTITEVEFFRLCSIDGMNLADRARENGRVMENQAVHEAVAKGAVAGARYLGNARYEVTQFLGDE